MLKAVFWDYQEDSRGAWLKCHIPNELIDERFISEVMHGEIRVDDGRRISSDQRKKIYALCRDISDYTGHDVEDLKEKLEWLLEDKEAVEKYKNEEIVNYILGIIATIISSDFSIVDMNPEIDGKRLDTIAVAAIIEEVEMFILMC